MSDGERGIFVGFILTSLVWGALFAYNHNGRSKKSTLRVVCQGAEPVKFDNHKIIDGMMTSTVDGVVVYFPSNCVFLVGE